VNDNRSDIPPPPDLGGEAAPGAYDLRTADGVPANPGLAIFPIVRYDSETRVRLLGTGFFITTTGLFVTAAHVLRAVFDRKGRQRFAIGMIHFLPDNIYYLRPILRAALHPRADVAVGVAAPMARNTDGEPLKNPILTLTTVRPALGTKVVTFAYPRHQNSVSGDVQQVHLAPTYYDGNVEEYFPDGHDRVLLPAPCYQTTISIHNGASGGPVFAPNGYVFGVNSTGFDGTDVSFVSRIDEIFQLTIDDVAMGSERARSVAVIELARADHILVRPRPVDTEVIAAS